MDGFQTIEVFVNFHGKEVRKKFSANTPTPVIDDWVRQVRKNGGF